MAAPLSPAPAAPRGRLAPSPTGRLHVGHARSFLAAWWSVRARGGSLVLRIEDLDRARVAPGAVDDVLRDLAWLGLDWDEGPLLQSGAPEPARAALEELVRRDLAYPCVCSRREIEALSVAPHASDGTLRYPGTCRGRFATLEEAEAAGTGPVGLRLRVPAGTVSWSDERLGPRTDDVGAEVGDFLLARRDGVLAYQLAVVVDDARQGVTEVVRGDDLVPSTPRQALLQELLELPRPRWFHLPLVVDPTGRRLAKRDRDLGLTELREAGVDGRAVVAWCARSLGLPSPDRVRPEERTADFRWDRVPAAPAVFGPEDRKTLQAARSGT